MILADEIIDLRKKNGLSQEELAAKLNVSRQAVSKCLLHLKKKRKRWDCRRFLQHGSEQERQ